MEITPHLGIGDLLLIKMKEVSNGLTIEKINISTNLIQQYKDSSYYNDNILFLDNFLKLLFPNTVIEKIINHSNQYTHLYEYEINKTYLYEDIFTPLNIYNGTLKSVPQNMEGQLLPINELKGNPPQEDCPISNLHRCKNENTLNFNIEYDDYIIFHTKVRIDGYSDIFINNDLPILIDFFQNFKTDKKIIILGERVIEKNVETITYNVISIYKNLLELKKNNIVIDLSEELLCSGNIKFESFLYQIELINKAKYNIALGIGGNLGLCNAFSENNLFYISKSNYYGLSMFQKISSHSFFDNINHMIQEIINKLSIKFIDINHITEEINKIESNEMYLPVSLGEAIDKLTILDIKCDKIKDERKNDVQKEYNILYEKLEEFIEKYKDLYHSMKKVNLIIWDQMDVLRDSKITDEDYLKLCKECIVSNDIRFRIKNKINLISNSSLKEQKSYKITRLILEINCNEELFSFFIEPIKYFSYLYDEIIIISSKNNNLIENTFYYDNTIKYNLDMENLEYKQKFIFASDNYSKDEIYAIMNIDKEMINLYI